MALICGLEYVEHLELSMKPIELSVSNLDSNLSIV